MVHVVHAKCLFSMRPCTQTSLSFHPVSAHIILSGGLRRRRYLGPITDHKYVAPYRRMAFPLPARIAYATRIVFLSSFVFRSHLTRSLSSITGGYREAYRTISCYVLEIVIIITRYRSCSFGFFIGFSWFGLPGKLTIVPDSRQPQ